MRIRTCKKLIPGQPGTKKLLEKYGETLLCVRYRYDMNRRKKLKTVEIIVEESPWEVNSRNIPGNKLVKIRVDYDEVLKAISQVSGW